MKCNTDICTCMVLLKGLQNAINFHPSKIAINFHGNIVTMATNLLFKVKNGRKLRIPPYLHRGQGYLSDVSIFYSILHNFKDVIYFHLIKSKPYVELLIFWQNPAVRNSTNYGKPNFGTFKEKCVYKLTCLHVCLHETSHNFASKN